MHFLEIVSIAQLENPQVHSPVALAMDVPARLQRSRLECLDTQRVIVQRFLESSVCVWAYSSRDSLFCHMARIIKSLVRNCQDRSSISIHHVIMK